MMDPAIHWLLALSLALLWLAAGWHKLRNPGHFATVVAAYDILPRGPAVIAGSVLPWLECALAVALLLPCSRSWAALSGAALLTLYAGALALNLGRGRTDFDCGCNGGGRTPLAWRLVWRNLLLLCLSLSLLLPVPARHMTAGHWTVTVIGAGIVCAVYVLTGAILRERAYGDSVED